MSFNASKYVNFVAQWTASNERLFLQYIGPRNDFDIIIIGSGIGGGILADDLADRIGTQKRILVLEAGSYLYPTHVYNLCRFPNFSIARHFGCDTFFQTSDEHSERYIGEKPQLNLGGRSIFWSGLIPTIQGWELEFFPPAVRSDLTSGLLNEAGEVMNESRSMGSTAQAIVSKLRQSPLAQHFSIQETPRALHQPYLTPDGLPKDQFFVEPTGVFNTAELLINQLGLTPGVSHGDGPGLQMLLNHFVEDVQNHGDHFEAVVRNTLDNQIRIFRAPVVVIAGGSIESPKLLRRSSMYPWFSPTVKNLLGRGLTDHPTTNEIATSVTNIGNVPIPRNSNSKIIFYSRGLPDPFNPSQTRFPFNVEMNINHEYWHLRENDPNERGEHQLPSSSLTGSSRLDIKFSFGNCLDDDNEIAPAAPFEYVPEIRFHNLSWMTHLSGSRFRALAGWEKSFDQVWEVLNGVTYQVFSQFQNDGREARPDGEVWYGQGGKGFGWGTVHHSAGSLRMPYRAAYNAPFQFDSAVDENLQVSGVNGLYVCDMSVMPFSSSANPVRTLVALALRLSRRLA
jgi:hypothetical protein